MLRALLFICCLTFTASLRESQAQESTPEDFQALGELRVGRWTSEVTLIADFPGLSKKAGEKLVVYDTFTWEADSKAFLERYTSSPRQVGDDPLRLTSSRPRGCRGCPDDSSAPRLFHSGGAILLIDKALEHVVRDAMGYSGDVKLEART